MMAWFDTEATGLSRFEVADQPPARDGNHGPTKPRRTHQPIDNAPGYFGKGGLLGKSRRDLLCASGWSSANRCTLAT